MAGKGKKREELLSKHRQVDVLQGQDATVTEAVRRIGATHQVFYRWSKLYGRTDQSQLARLKELGKDSRKLRRGVSDLSLVKQPHRLMDH